MHARLVRGGVNILANMPKSTDAITFDPKPLKTGEGWYIVVTHPGGMQEHIPGFRDEAETRDWLAGKGRETWLRERAQVFARLRASVTKKLRPRG